MKRWLWLLLLLSIGLNAGLLARALSDRGDDDRPRMDAGQRFAEDGRRGGAGREFPGADRWMRRFDGLGLTEEQEGALRDVGDDGVREEFLEHKERMRGLFLEIKEALLVDDLQTELITDLRRRVGAAQAELDSLVSVKLLRELEILTPEQRRAYLERIPWDRHGPPGRGEGRGRRAEQP